MDVNNMNKAPIDQPIAEVAPVPEIATPEVATPETAPVNDEAIQFISRFAEGSDTSTPEGISAGLLTIVKSMAPIYDKLYDVAESAPETAAFIADLLETGDVVKSLARNYDKEEMLAVIEEIENDDYEADKGMFNEKVTATKAKKETFSKNLEVSLKDISEFMEEKKDWDEAKAAEFENFVIKHYDDGKDGLITKKDLAMLEKAFKYDGDVAEAEENGKAMGRNEKIVAKKLTKAESDSYLPEASAGITKAPPPPPAKKSFASSFMKDVKL